MPDNQTVAELRHELEAYKRHTATLEQENHTLRVDNQRLRHTLAGGVLGDGGSPPVEGPAGLSVEDGGRESRWAGGAAEGERGVVPAKRGSEEGEEASEGVDEKRAKVE